MMPNNDKKIIVISGLSGAGKSVALQSLEDIGYYCIDNLPLTLLSEFSRQLEENSNNKRAAVSIDSRNLDFLNVLLDENSTHLLTNIDQLIFVQASSETLLRRYSETRRKHPLSNLLTNLAQSIDKEHELLRPLQSKADHVIDTSQLTPHELREKVRAIVGRAKQGIMLSIESFGFKHGLPRQADYIFDVRCLPNPYWDDSIRHLSGIDDQIISFLADKPEVQQMCDDIAVFIQKWLPAFEAENRSYLTIAVGCTGGRHRSVYIANQVVKWFRQTMANVQVQHRDL